MAQDWASSSSAPAGSAPGPAHLLRPLTTGEVLDNTFALYRSRFWLFAGLASLSGAWQVVLQALQLLARHLVLLRLGTHAASIEAQASSSILMLLMLPVTAVIYAAAVYALGEVYLGRRVTATQALKTTRTLWLRYVGISLWWGWSAIWVGLLVLLPALFMILVIKGIPMIATGGVLLFIGIPGAMIYGTIAYIRNSLAVAASVVEMSGVRASMRRSKQLTAGTKGRIFLVLLIAGVLYLVVGMVESPLAILIVRNPTAEHIMAQAIMLLLGFVAHTLISPVMVIGLTLVYFDQRVRNEAFDLLMLLGPEDPAPGLVSPAVMASGPESAPAYYAEPVYPPEPPVELPVEPPAEPLSEEGHRENSHGQDPS